MFIAIAYITFLVECRRNTTAQTFNRGLVAALTYYDSSHPCLVAAYLFIANSCGY